MAEFRLKASTDMPTMLRWRPNSPDGSLPPARSRDAMDLLALAAFCLDHQINSSAAMLRLVTTPKTLYQPLLDMRGTEICPSIPGSGGLSRRSLVAMPERYSGLFLEWPIQLGTHLRLLTRVHPPTLR